MGKLLAIGLAVMDVVLKPINVLDYSIDSQTLDAFTMTTGGDTMNAAINAHFLGLEADLISKQACDSVGDFVVNRLESLGMTTQYVVSEPEGVGSISVVMINDQGDRTFYGRRGVNINLKFEEIDLSIMDNGYDVLLFNSFYALADLVGENGAKILKAAKDRGMITVTDLVEDRYGLGFEALRPCLPYIDYFLPSMLEAGQHAHETDVEKIADFYLEHGAKNIGIKLGDKGSYFKNADTSFYTPAYKVPVVDTTGAGDAFVGGFAVAAAKGWDVRRCCQFASAVGSHAVMHLGTTTTPPTMEAIEKLMAEYPTK
ncbi:MAG: carbohydrate kinase family protein [Christensenellales bacterium]|jgi:sugar/nucleoside kinase (ribokinase family)